MKPMTLGLSLLSLALAASLPAQAQDAQAPKMPFLHPLFSDNAVLQRDRKVPVWGWGAPGASIVVKMDTSTQTVRCGADGKWQANVGPFPAGGPHELSVAGDRAGEFARRSNILFGDVWICSGQSNMEMGIGGVNNSAAEIAAANDPDIRLYTVPKATSPLPQLNTGGKWDVCTPTTVAAGGWGGFSAVGYFFGRELNHRLHIPIGLIHTSWGGTIAEAWVSSEALNRDVPEFKGAIDTFRAADTTTPFAAQMAAWWAKNDAGTAGGYAKADFDDAGWKSLQAPGTWENSGMAEMAGFDGVAWFRRVVDVPAGMAGRDLTLHLGTIDDRDTTYWNGEEIGHGDEYNAPRNYKIAGARVKAGRNVIAVRVLDTGGGGGMIGPAEAMKLEIDTPANGALDSRLAPALPLGGEWKIQPGKALAQLTAVPTNPNNNPNIPTALYNSMISPLVPYGVKGAIWYQGESNAGRGDQYKKLLPSLIRDWRSRFGSGDFPFYIVQLAGFMAPDEAPKDGGWARLREAQSFTAQTVGHSGVAMAIDVGEEKDIHPKNKQDVGRRLALLALANDYGQDVVSQGPTLASATPQGGSMVLKFANTGGELSIKGEEGRVFAIAGADKKFVWATPVVAGDTITLSSPDVKEPVSVRYGWSDLPRANVYNKAGLPTSPFRTDKD